MSEMRKKLAGFWRNAGGNFSVLFAALALALFGGVGFALDYSNLSRVRQDMQNAADAAALVAAKETEMSAGDRKELARRLVAGNNQVELKSLDIKIEGDIVTVDMIARIPTLIMGIMGQPEADVHVTAQARQAADTLEVVFALDVSGSMLSKMSSGKTRMQELQTSMKTLLDRLKAESPFKIRAAIVPFTMTVNIGTNQSKYVTGTNNPLFAGTEWKGCVFERAAPDHVKDGLSGKWTAYVWPPMPDARGAGDFVFANRSNGTMLGYASLAETSSKTKSALVDGPNYNCVRFPIVPLDSNLDKIKTEIDALQALGNQGTMIAPAVTWAMRVLSPEAPFTEGVSWGNAAKKLIIVVTDGDQVTEAEFYGDGVANQSKNSLVPWTYDPAWFGLGGKIINTGVGPADNLSPYGFIRDSRPFGGENTDKPKVWDQHMDELVALSDAACAEAKAKIDGRSIEIMTMGVSDWTKPGTRAYTALHNCASSPDNHFFVRDTADILKAFDTILSKLTQLRVSS
ncbi:MAG: VWA domain-containing protein [Notoacmeibacter sp.]|nr:VWA domain-containing protein [Notoacmeibacter sp.]MCC0033283.1 VWA domain-containing protein [Brucellaceae bacterium]